MIDFRKNTILFGGSFDPIHLGHLHIAREALKAVNPPAQLVFVPARESPGKPLPRASAEQRTAWIEESIRDAGYLLWDTELKRQGPSYTVETLEEAHRLGASRERLYWLLGADSYAHFESWKNPERIRELAILLVLSRPGTSLQRKDPRDVLREVAPHPASSSQIRAEIARGKIPDMLAPPVAEWLKNLPLKSKNPYAIQE